MFPALRSVTVRYDRCFQRINKLKPLNLNEDRKICFKHLVFMHFYVLLTLLLTIGIGIGGIL